MALSEYIEGLRVVTRLGERCIAVSLQVQGSDKTKLEVHGSVRARLKVMNITRLGERCIAVPLQVQDSDKTKLEVHGSVRARLQVTNSYKIRPEVHSSATAGARQ